MKAEYPELDVTAAPVDQRRQWVHSLQAKLRDQHEISESELALLHQLAKDEQYLVRQDVAELLVYLPDPDFSELTGRLQNDANAYVSRSAVKATSRRRKVVQVTRRRGRDLEELAERRARLVSLVGDKGADQALTFADARFARMADAISHDLLNVLTGLESKADELASQLDHQPNPKKIALRLQDDLRYISGYLRSFAAYASTTNIDRHQEPLREIVDNAIGKARKHLAAKALPVEGIAISTEVADIRIHAARELIIQAIANLVVNACESFQSGDSMTSGTVAVRAGLDQHMVVITIEDSGCGMDPDELDNLRLFLPGRKNRRKKDSHGLGLLNVRKCIEAHDGHFAIDSTLDEGTTVTITLPAAEGEV